MARFATVAVVFAVAAVVGVHAGALFGSYDGRQQFPNGANRIQEMTSWLGGKRQAVFHYYHSFCSEESNQKWFFDQVLPYIWKAGSVPAITWTPTICDKPDRTVVARILDGKFDSYILQWANRLRRFLGGPDGMYGNADDRRIYLSVAHESNGNWEPWSFTTGANYKLMWKRIRDIFARAGLTDATRLQWVWTANNQDVGSNKMENFYPGNALVDWVAVDGYNWGTAQAWSSWTSPFLIFDPMVQRLKAVAPGKPVGIWEVATASKGGSIAQRSQWYTQLFQYVRSSGIKMVLFFNADKEADWAVFGGKSGDSTAGAAKAWQSYKLAVRDSYFIGAGDARTNKRLLTDAQFQCKTASAAFVETDADAGAGAGAGVDAESKEAEEQSEEVATAFDSAEGEEERIAAELGADATAAEETELIAAAPETFAEAPAPAPAVTVEAVAGEDAASDEPWNAGAAFVEVDDEADDAEDEEDAEDAEAEAEDEESDV